MFELDHSQCHKRFSKDAHVVKIFNLTHGGTVPFVRSIKVNPDSLGPFDHPNKLKVGEMAHHAFTADDPPPKCKPDMAKFDCYEEAKMHDIGIKDLRKALKEKNLPTDGNVSDLRRRYKNQKPPMPIKHKHAKF